MCRHKNFLKNLTLLIVASLSVFSVQNLASDTRSKSEVKTLIWKDPGNISEKDLFWGNCSEAGAPRQPFKFVSEDKNGTQPKVEVTDANGIKWKVKFGEEVHAEIAAARLLWAFGYLVEEDYFVPTGVIQGASGLKRTKEFIGPDGSFQSARFEKRPKNVERTKTAWAWGDNPFLSTRELSGLRILMTMINNWDTRRVSKNNIVLRVTNSDGSIEDWYVVEDLGSTFGNMGRYPFSKRTRWDLDDFKKQPFIDGVKDNELELHYRGGARSINKVPIAHARWFSSMASRLSDSQIRRAFEAAGANQSEIDAFASRLMEKIGELQKSTGEGLPAPQ